MASRAAAVSAGSQATSSPSIVVLLFGTISPTLNDVFLKYTGRHIRDESASSSWLDDAMRLTTQGSKR